MSVAVSIFYPQLSRLIGGSEDVSAEGATVGECLADLERRHPGVERLLFDSRGRLQKPVYVFVNAEGMAKADLSQEVTERDRLIVAVLATGG